MAERPCSVEDLGVKIRGEISMEVSRKDSWSELQDFYRGKRVLVTGHTGFKGYRVCFKRPYGSVPV